jgi:hypothetical protein
MEYMNINELLEYKPEEKGIRVSIFMPLETEPARLNMNQIRLKNLIKEGKSRLSEEDFLPADQPAPELDEFFHPATEFSNNLKEGVDGRGLAIFLEPTAQHIHPIPISVEESVFIGPGFNIRPLLPLLTYKHAFYLLSLSQNKVQLWRGNPFKLEQIDVPQLPMGKEDALALEDPERSLQTHSSSGQSGNKEAIHHGHEAEKEKKGAILRYFRMVNEAVMVGLADEEAPLLIAAVDYLIPIYREANTYPNLLDEGVSGNPDHLNSQELHEKAWQTAEQHFIRARETVIEQFRQIKGTNLSSQSVEEIVPAASNGRVDTLLVKNDTKNPVLGYWHEETNTVEKCQEASFKCIDLLNLAAIKTLQNSGVVYPLDAGDMPFQSALAAKFRYSL